MRRFSYLPNRCPYKIQHHLLHEQLNWTNQCGNGRETPISGMEHADVAHRNMETLDAHRPDETQWLPIICKTN